MPFTAITQPGAAPKGPRLFNWQPSNWQMLSMIVAFLVLVPLAVLAFAWAEPAWEIWAHLRETILNRLILNTITLILGVLTGTLLIGVSLAWLTGACEFPGRQFFSWTLLLPLAMPTYVLAFLICDLREVLSW